MARIAYASVGSPMTAEMPAATRSTITTNSVKCVAKRIHTGRGLDFGKALGPCCCCRRVASLSLKPSIDTPSCFAKLSEVIVWGKLESIFAFVGDDSGIFQLLDAVNGHCDRILTSLLQLSGIRHNRS